MIRTLLLVPLLLAFTAAKQQWNPPKTCFPRFVNNDCQGSFIPQELLSQVHEDLQNEVQLFERTICLDQQQRDEYSRKMDEIVANVLNYRAGNPCTNLVDETKLIGLTFNMAYDYCLTNGRQVPLSKDETLAEALENAVKHPKGEKIIESYRTCTSENDDSKHSLQLLNDLKEAIQSNALSSFERVEEFRAKVLTAGRADLAALNARKLECFITSEEQIRTYAHSSNMNCKADCTLKSKKESIKAVQMGIVAGQQALSEWKAHQTLVVKQIFDNLRNQESQTKILASQEERLNALLLMAGMEDTDAEKAKDQFLMISGQKVPQLDTGFDQMMMTYNECLDRPRDLWSKKLLAKVNEKIEAASKGNNKLDFEVDTWKDEDYWRRHLLSMQVDLANEMASSLHCFATTERQIFYKDVQQ